MKKILILGALGQIGSELSLAISDKYGKENVVISDIVDDSRGLFTNNIFEKINVCNYQEIEKVVKRHNIDTIVNLAAILSAKGEQNPKLAWDINVNGFINIVNIGLNHKIDRILNPSSIAVFGPQSILYNTPQDTILRPNTMYGITKVTGEMLAGYYAKKNGLDIRGLRYPGIISYKTLPGGGTTDYAVEIFFEAVKNKKYTCFVSEDTCLPMMYMPDCIKATLSLLEADRSTLKHNVDYNLNGMSFMTKELSAEIKKHIPEFKITYNPDYRREIARYWPASVDDSCAQAEWGWKPEYNLETMTNDMILNIKQLIG